MFLVEGVAYAEPCGRRARSGMREGDESGPVWLERGKWGTTVRQTSREPTPDRPTGCYGVRGLYSRIRFVFQRDVSSCKR